MEYRQSSILTQRLIKTKQFGRWLQSSPRVRRITYKLLSTNDSLVLKIVGFELSIT